MSIVPFGNYSGRLFACLLTASGSSQAVVCELRTVQPQAALSATHTGMGEPPEAAQSSEELFRLIDRIGGLIRIYR